MYNKVCTIYVCVVHVHVLYTARAYGVYYVWGVCMCVCVCLWRCVGVCWVCLHVYDSWLCVQLNLG